MHYHVSETIMSLFALGYLTDQPDSRRQGSDVSIPKSAIQLVPAWP